MMLISAPLIAETQTAAATTELKHTTIKADELKSWYGQKKSMTVIDARGKQYFDGRTLPDAKWLPYDSAEKDIVAALPDKKSVIVVYCASSGCPVAGWVYDKLHTLGYSNVYEYHEGFNDWQQKGYPITKQKG
jgi:rhodanese-related sulfurtransferase